MGMNLTNEQVSELDTMLRKIATKNQRWCKRELEDIVSDLWINALQIIEKRDSVDMEIIAHSSKLRMVDMVRKNMREETLPYDPFMFSHMLPTELRDTGKGEDASEYESYIYCSNSNQSESSIEVLEILDLFEEGSKERLFVETWMKVLKIIDSTDEIPDKALDGYIARDILGYAGSSSNGYGRLRWKVREVLVANGYRMSL